MTRRVFTAIPLSAMMLIADERTDILDIFTPLASALAAGDAQAFLSGFDHKMEGFADLSAWVTALVETYEITSSVDLVRIQGDDIELEWSVRLRSRIPTAKSDDRQQSIIARIGKNKKITSLRPLSFFKP